MTFDELLEKQEISKAVSFAKSSNFLEEGQVSSLLLLLMQEKNEEDFVLVHQKFNYKVSFFNYSFLMNFVNLNWNIAFNHFIKNKVLDTLIDYETEQVSVLNRACEKERISMVKVLIENTEITTFLSQKNFYYKKDFIYSSFHFLENYELCALFLQKQFCVDIFLLYNEQEELDKIIETVQKYVKKLNIENF